MMILNIHVSMCVGVVWVCVVLEMIEIDPCVTSLASSMWGREEGEMEWAILLLCIFLFLSFSLFQATQRNV